MTSYNAFLFVNKTYFISSPNKLMNFFWLASNWLVETHALDIYCRSRKSKLKNSINLSKNMYNNDLWKVKLLDSELRIVSIQGHFHKAIELPTLTRPNPIYTPGCSRSRGKDIPNTLKSTEIQEVARNMCLCLVSKLQTPQQSLLYVFKSINLETQKREVTHTCFIFWKKQNFNTSL